MEDSGNYRHELKYQISRADYFAIRQRVRSVMKRDPHADANGIYGIQSLYFDNYRDKALLEKVNGVSQREKFRIRYYNEDLSYITLEKKIKNKELCKKLDAPLTKEEYQRILLHPGSWMAEHRETLLRELYYKMQIQQLRPRVFVSYQREAFIYDPGNVRITFDFDIRSSLFQREFLQYPISDIPANDKEEGMVMEVKYDAFLPEIIQCLLQAENLRQTAFSKYAICRRFG